MAKDKKEKDKSRRPPNTAFHQQRLQAWQPVLDIYWVVGIYFAVSIILLPVGGWLLYQSRQPQTMDINYSGCAIQAPDDYAEMSSSRVTSTFHSARNIAQKVQWKRQTNQTVTYPLGYEVGNTTFCYLQFPIPNDVPAPVFLYYKMTRFYQNHRRYIKSFDADQLKGKVRTSSQIDNSQCDPLKVDGATNKPYYPCGLIANSYFNDTFNAPVLLPQNGGTSNVTYNMTTKGIAWSSDGSLYGKTVSTPDEVVPPPNWRRKYPDYSRGIPDLSTDESFWNWMRVAAFATFSKLAMRNDNETLAEGQYEMVIWDEFNVTEYEGEKHMVLTTITKIGMFNNVIIAYLYLASGAICLLTGIIFAISWKIKSRRMGDHAALIPDPVLDRGNDRGTSSALPPRNVTERH